MILHNFTKQIVLCSGKGAMEEVEKFISNNDLKLLKQLLGNKTPEFCGQALYIALKNGVDGMKRINNNDSGNDEGIHQAIEKKNMDLVEIFLDFGADVSVIIDHPTRCTVFGYACFNASKAIVKLMMEQGVDLTLDDHWRLFPLEQVFLSGDKDKIECILNLENAEIINKWKLLHRYVKCETPQEDIIMRLLKLGAIINDLDENRYSVLNYATRSKNLKIVEFLIKNGANIIRANESMEHRLSELTFAVKYGTTEIIEILLKNGANLNYRENFPLTMACTSSRDDIQEVIRLLLKYGANINKQDNVGRTPLLKAVEHGKEAIIDLLLDLGATKDNTALVEAVRGQLTRIVKLLLDRGFDVNYLQNGVSVLIWAISKQDEEIIKLLLNYGVRLDDITLNNVRISVLPCAASTGNKRIVQLLLDHGADLFAEMFGNTALLMSTYNGHDDLSKFLIREIILKKSVDVGVGQLNLNLPKGKENLKAYQNECVAEVKLLKSKRFEDSNLSYFDILTIKDAHELAKLASNENIVKVIKSSGFDVDYPIYSEMIVENFDKGIRVN